MNTSLIKRTFVMLGLLPVIVFGFVDLLHAEEKPKVKAEELIPMPDQSQSQADLNSLRRARLTEEQAHDQMKYMMVKGWKRINDDLVNTGTFMPFGMVLSPEGEFRPLYLAEQEKVGQAFALGMITKNLQNVAKTRAMWGVGLMYITGREKKDGTFDRRIMVMTEHIAGWAWHWAYPFKVVDGEVKLGAPIETPVKPVYFTQK